MLVIAGVLHMHVSQLPSATIKESKLKDLRFCPEVTCPCELSLNLTTFQETVNAVKTPHAISKIYTPETRNPDYYSRELLEDTTAENSTTRHDRDLGSTGLVST